MSERKGNIIRRFAGLIFGLITVLGFFFILITYLVITHYHEASTQLLNKDVAAHIAKFASPFEGGGIDKTKADSVFYNAMVLSPAAEVYFLDPSGKIIAFHPDDNPILERNIPLDPIKKYILSKGENYIKGIDPRDPSHEKIFSASAVLKGDANDGYIYVILNSKKAESVLELIFGNHILNLAIFSFLVVIVLSLVFSLLYLRRITKNYRRFIEVLERFESGDYAARFKAAHDNELQPITTAFNRMAEQLSASIAKLTLSEQDRKNFIATISHDLRTPLAIARGYTETLMLKKDSTEIKPADRAYYSQLIFNKILQLENMVKQLFELSKMDAVEFTPAKEPFVISEILQEAVNTFQLPAKENNIVLECTECLYHVWINADIAMMERVFQNLIENALKNTPEHGKIITWLEAEGKELVFQITNTGDPLAPELVDWINNSRSGETLLSSRPPGAGLGFIIVQKILHLHGSTLKAATDKGLNKFSFRLPVYMQTAE